MFTDNTKQLSVPSDLRNSLLDFALISNINLFKINPYGANRRVCNLNWFDLPLSQEVKEFAAFCFKEVFNTDVIEEPNFGNFLGVNGPGAFVHRHKDNVGPNNEWHIRLNFLIQKPYKGGLPIIENTVLDVDEGQCWINLASKWSHSSTPVEGDRSRVVLSLGSFIPEDIGLKVIPNQDVFH